MRGIRIASGGGSSSQVTFKYEQLPSFYFSCGHISHEEWDCLVEDDRETKEVHLHFGELLRASPRKIFSRVTTEEIRAEQLKMDRIYQMKL